ncbi:MAG: MFS transporter [Flavobacteriaceae bacterium]
MQTKLKVKLSSFMFLQYFIWGSWYVSMATYLSKTLQFEGAQIGFAYGAFAIGAMISPFFVGLIADRYFPSEKILSFLGIIGGFLLFILPHATTFGSFYPLLIIYCATFVPTLALGTSLSLHHLTNPKQDLPIVKAFSAVGFIAGGITLSIVFEAEQSATQFYIAGTASLVLGLFSLILPHTPPKKTGKDVQLRDVLGLDALALLKKPSFAIFIICMFLICIPLYFYFVNMNLYVTELGWKYTVAKMSLAQVSDFIFLLLLPLILRYFGYKKTIAIGIIAWAARYFLLAGSVDSISMQTTFVYIAILLHGVCYDFIFITGQLYVDSEANERIRGAAQGLFAFILWGLGAFVGTQMAGIFLASHTLSTPVGSMAHDWQGIWIYPAWGAVIVLLIFMIFFREPKNKIMPSVITGQKEESMEMPLKKDRL